MDAMVAILEKDPPWAKLPERVPGRVRELIARCLEKDAKKRLRDIGDARIDLESLLGERSRPDPRRFLAGPRSSGAARTGAIRTPARRACWARSGRRSRRACRRTSRALSGAAATSRR
jgi:hypothetical protein